MNVSARTQRALWGEFAEPTFDPSLTLSRFRPVTNSVFPVSPVPMFAGQIWRWIKESFLFGGFKMRSPAEALMRSSLRRKCFIRNSITAGFKKVSSERMVTLEREMGWWSKMGFPKLIKPRLGFGLEANQTQIVSNCSRKIAIFLA
jgi:hypothetical protein